MISIVGEQMVLAKSHSIQRFLICQNDSWQITEHVVQRVNCFQYSERQGDFEKLLIVLLCLVSVDPIWALVHCSSRAAILFTTNFLVENEADDLGCHSKDSILIMILHKVCLMCFDHNQVVATGMIFLRNGRCS